MYSVEYAKVEDYMDVQTASLGDESVGKLLFKMSVPATVGMMVGAVYNIVDTIFVGRGAGVDAIGGLAIAFPVYMVFMSFAFAIGVGGASVFSIALGEKNDERAKKIVGNALFSIVTLSILASVLGLVFVEEVLYLFGATPSLYPYARDYIVIIFSGSIFFSLTVVLNSIVRAEGHAKAAMITMILGTVINIFLDPIFIYENLSFNLFGFNIIIPTLGLGIKGAAWATIISKFISFAYIVMYIYGNNTNFKIRLRDIKFDLEIQKRIFAIGISVFVRQISTSIVAIVVNNLLRVYGGDNAIVIMGIVNRLLIFFFLPMFGVVQGMQPIIGYNYGAKKMERVKKTINLSIISMGSIAIVSWILAQGFSYRLMGIFTTDLSIIEEGSSVMRIILFFLPVVCIQIAGTAFYQSVGKAKQSLLLALLRQIILFIPIVFILPAIFPQNELLAIWISFPLADILSTVISGLMLKFELKKLKNKPFEKQNNELGSEVVACGK